MSRTSVFVMILCHKCSESTGKISFLFNLFQINMYIFKSSVKFGNNIINGNDTFAGLWLNLIQCSHALKPRPILKGLYHQE